MMRTIIELIQITMGLINGAVCLVVAFSDFMPSSHSIAVAAFAGASMGFASMRLTQFK